MQEIFVSREHLLDDLLNIYTDRSILYKNINVTFLEEKGQDMGGLTKELFFLFWEAAEERFFTGEDVIVPFLPLHNKRKEREHFQVLGRVLTHMAIIVKCIPRKIGKTIFSILADRHPTAEDLLDDFLLLSTIEERNIICLGLKDFSALTENNVDFLQSLFIANDLHEVPKAGEFKQQILAIAEHTILDKPKDLVLLMRDGIPLDLLMTVWRPLTRELLHKLLRKETPTVEKLLAVIQTEDNYNLTNKEERVLHFFKSYICSLKEDNDMLTKLLVFITGSANAPNCIKVTFNNVLDPLLRRPIAHTCSNNIELASSYSTYQQFKKEMTAYLRNEYTFHYSQI